MTRDSRIQQNRTFDEMLKPALKRLEGKALEKIAENTGISYCKEQGIFSLRSLGQEIQIHVPDWKITPELNEWHHLLLLHYMDLADGAPLTGQLMAFGELEGGMVRGGGFDRQSENQLSRQLGAGTCDSVRKACESLGGEIVSSNADLCAVFYLFPRYLLTLKLWFADEEIPGSGRILPDRSAGHYLAVEDAVTAGSLLLEKLIGKM